jgi:hypothetical protein
VSWYKRAVWQYSTCLLHAATVLRFTICLSFHCFVYQNAFSLKSEGRMYLHFQTCTLIYVSHRQTETCTPYMHSSACYCWCDDVTLVPCVCVWCTNTHRHHTPYTNASHRAWKRVKMFLRMIKMNNEQYMYCTCE